MENKIDVELLKDKKLFVATPMYGGQCSGQFTHSFSTLLLACTKLGVPVMHSFLYNESLITRARNYLVDSFLSSDATHMLFIDSDIGFNYKDALMLLQLTDSSKGMDIVTGPYPKKVIAWEKVHKAARSIDNPFDLSNYVGDYVFNPVSAGNFPLNEPMEIKEGGTGFMMIAREAFEKYAEAYPELRYTPDHKRTEKFDGSRDIVAFFDTVIDPESKRYLSEDYMFSQYARKIGLKIWMCPWMELEHVGMYQYKGSMHHISSIKESPTTSVKSNEKYFKNDLTKISLTDINKTVKTMNGPKAK